MPITLSWYGSVAGSTASPTELTTTLLSDTGTVVRWSVIGAGLALTVLVLVWFAATRKHPEHAAEGPDEMASAARKPDGVARRPAGPAAENMDPDPPGGRTPPGPWPGSSPVPPNASGAPD